MLTINTRYKKPYGSKLAFVYALLAGIAMACNIASQDITIRLYSGPFAVELSVLVGTAVGLLTKYSLDKQFIFLFRAKSLTHDTGTFILYSFMGIFTTLIFWSFEFGFEYMFDSRIMRYLGAAIGLTIGYFTKYQLDKRFVFRSVE